MTILGRSFFFFFVFIIKGLSKVGCGILKNTNKNVRIKGEIVMNNNAENLLGYMELETGSKLITPMNDVFLNFTYQNKENWEDLRVMANIFFDEYDEICKDTKIRPIEEVVAVKTQFPFFKEPKSNRPKAPDIRIDSLSKVVFIDFENNPHSSKPPVPTRSTQYLGFALSRGADKQQSTMWLLNGGISILLNGKVFSNYVFMDEKDYRRHPNEANMLYVDLKKLAKMKTKAGELASVLTAVNNDPKHEDVKAILHNLRQNFEEFIVNTEVRDIMTREEQVEAQGRNKERIEIVKNGLENNVPIETISIMTGLSVEEVEEFLEILHDL